MPKFQRKSLFRLTLPLFISAFFSISVSFVDTIILSAYSDELAGAVSVANQILGMAYDFSGLLAVGAAILTAQYLGKDDIESAQRISVIAIIANTVLSFGIALNLFIGGPHFIDWVNTPPEIALDALIYLYVIAVAMIMNGFITAASAVLRAFGHTIEIMIAGILVSIPYLLLEYILIFGNWGFPEMGVYGSALATLIVRVGSVLFLVWVLNRRLKFKWRIGLSSGHFWREVIRLLRISFPSVGDNLAYNFYQLTMLSFIAGFGVTAVLTRSYVLTLVAFVYLVTYVISQGNEILVGYDKGSGDNHQPAFVYTALQFIR